MKKALVALTAAMFALAAGGCSARHHGPAAGQLTLGMVTDVGGLGDRSFNDSAYRGLVRARSELGAYIQVLQSRSAADYQPNLNALTNLHVNMIYAIGFLMSLDLDQIAKQNPAQIAGAGGDRVGTVSGTSEHGQVADSVGDAGVDARDDSKCAAVAHRPARSVVIALELRAGDRPLARSFRARWYPG